MLISWINVEKERNGDFQDYIDQKEVLLSIQIVFRLRFLWANESPPPQKKICGCPEKEYKEGENRLKKILEICKNVASFSMFRPI